MASPHTDIVITGGGTAGHINPALAVADALVRRGHDKSSILFVGAHRGIERERLPPTGYRYVLLPGRGIVRRLSMVNAVAVAGLVVAFARAFVLVGRHRPEVVVSVGGYGGVACALAARAWRIPVVTVNVDAVVGLANRLVGRFAVISVVAFPGTAIPRAVVTGVPVRDEILAVDRSPEGRASARKAMHIEPGQHLVVIVGGSLGAKRLNDAAAGLRTRYADRADLVIHHIAGERDYDRLVHEPAIDGVLEYRLVEYEDQMGEVLGAADLLIGRAGAVTIAELRVTGVPSILVPLPNAPSDHQRKNAEALASLGGAVVVADADATADCLADAIDTLLDDEGARTEMERAARSDTNRDSAGHIAGIIDDVVIRSRRTT
jgi:undecaprenyldiphospho-muramoylpentapeptide beta-N-acetylglucosaminyltransferase